MVRSVKWFLLAGASLFSSLLVIGSSYASTSGNQNITTTVSGQNNTLSGADTSNNSFIVGTGGSFTGLNTGVALTVTQSPVVPLTISTSGNGIITEAAPLSQVGAAGLNAQNTIVLMNNGTPSVYNTLTQGSSGSISGGIGGQATAGGYTAPNLAGGNGGNAIVNNSAYSVVSVTAGNVTGGNGGAGVTSSTGGTTGGQGGNGGYGISLSSLSTANISGVVNGGAGGAGGTGSTNGNGGAGGNGSYGLLINNQNNIVNVTAGGFLIGGNGGTGGSAGVGSGIAGLSGSGAAGIQATGNVSGLALNIGGGTVVTGGLGGSTRATAIDLSANTGTATVNLTGATIGSASTPAANALALSSNTGGAAGGDTINLSGTNNLNGGIHITNTSAANNGTVNLTVGTTTIGSVSNSAADIGQAGASTSLTALNIKGTGALNTYGNVYTTTTAFTGAGSVGLLAASGGQNLSGSVTATGAGTTGLGTLVSANTSGTNNLLGTIGTSTDYLGSINLTGTGTTVAASTSFVNSLSYNANAVFTESSVNGGSLISNVSTSANNTGTLNTINTSGNNIFGAVGGVGNLLKVVTFNGSGGSTTVLGNLYATNVGVNDNSTLNTQGNISGTSVTLGNDNNAASTLSLAGTSNLNTAINSFGNNDHGILVVAGNVTTGGLASNASDIGSVFGLASTTINNGAVLNLNDNLTAAITTVDAGGQLTLGASRNINGAFVNNGSLAIGTNTATITGNITGTNGTITEDIGGSSATTGTIINSGNTVNPTFTNGLTITPVVASGVVITNNTLIDLIHANSSNATPVSGPITVSSNIPLVKWNEEVLTSSGTDVFGGATHSEDIALISSYVDASTVAGVTKNSASSLNGLMAYQGTNPTLLTLLGVVQNSTSGTMLNTAGAQLRPEINGAAQQTAFQTLDGALNSIESHNDQVRLTQAARSGISSGEALTGTGFWGQGFGSTGNQGQRNQIDGYDINTLGTSFGADTRVSNNVRVGTSFTFANTGVDDHGARVGSNLKTNSYIGAVYATYEGMPWYIDGNVSFGVENTDTRRLIDFTPATTLLARGNYGSQQAGFGVEGGYPFQIADRTYLTPFAGFGYTYLNQDSYTESGAGGADLSVSSNNTFSARTKLGVKVAAYVPSDLDNWTLKPNASLQWIHEYNPDAPDLTSTYMGGAGSASFTNTGIAMPEDTGVVSIGIDVASNDDWTITAKTDFEVKDSYTGYGGLLQVRKDF